MAKKKAKKPLPKRALKKTRGGAAYIRFDGIDGETAVKPIEGKTGSVTFTGLE